MNDVVLKKYDHCPAHLFVPGCAYFITAATLFGKPVIGSNDRKMRVIEELHTYCHRDGWLLYAWVVLDNHYHFLTQSPNRGAEDLPRLIGDLHSITAREWKSCDREPGRQVWCNYWDKCITSEYAFNTRINYIHWNPVKHGYVTSPDQYPFSSYGEFFKKIGHKVHRFERAFPESEADVYEPFPD